jgi:hypothetical protein
LGFDSLSLVIDNLFFLVFAGQVWVMAMQEKMEE